MEVKKQFFGDEKVTELHVMAVRETVQMEIQEESKLLQNLIKEKQDENSITNDFTNSLV